MEPDPTVTDPDHYKVVFENDRVRVLSYHDRPGDKTSLHRHPDSVLVTLSACRRRMTVGEEETQETFDLEMAAHEVVWVPERQMHKGENIGDTDTRSIIVELK